MTPARHAAGGLARAPRRGGDRRRAARWRRAGRLVGGVGVSGAPGGDADEACAKAGIEAVRDKLEF